MTMNFCGGRSLISIASILSFELLHGVASCYLMERDSSCSSVNPRDWESHEDIRQLSPQNCLRIITGNLSLTLSTCNSFIHLHLIPFNQRKDPSLLPPTPFCLSQKIKPGSMKSLSVLIHEVLFCNEIIRRDWFYYQINTKT
jgi:hypothetical protein